MVEGLPVRVKKGGGAVSVTYELTTRILETAKPSLTKETLINKLNELGFLDVVEGMVDGISDALPSTGDDEEALFSCLDDRLTPVLIYHASQEHLRHLMQKLTEAFPGGLQFSLTALPDDAWSGAWDVNETLIPTAKFYITPRDYKGDVPEGLRHLPLASAYGFGDGRHAATHCLLKLLERQDGLQGSLLDCGTGTGILAIAASYLGFGPITATEIDADVLREATLNGKLHKQNNISWHLTDVPPEGSYQVIVANILAPVLHDLMPFFAKNLAVNGVLLMSGFIAKEKDVLIERAKSLGLVDVDEEATRSWLAVSLKKTADHVSRDRHGNFMNSGAS